LHFFICSWRNAAYSFFIMGVPILVTHIVLVS
jgi:hydrogenase-4 membrane subunit HyfE